MEKWEAAALPGEEPGGFFKNLDASSKSDCSCACSGAAIAREMVASFEDLRAACGEYRGVKMDDAERQCRHEDHPHSGNWCSWRDCPLLAAAVDEAGIE
jgi:hypothetical protein